MAYTCIDTEWKNSLNGNICKYICDSEEDIAMLPESKPGSMAIIAIEGSPVYVVNASGQWVVI